METLFEMVPMVYPGAPDARRSDPVTSHVAADRAVRVPAALAVERALIAAGRPVIADEVYRIARFELGLFCTPQRVRTVLAEKKGGPWVRLEETAMTGFGNPAHLWVAKECL